jgi:hypothetical protein
VVLHAVDIYVQQQSSVDTHVTCLGHYNIFLEKISFAFLLYSEPGIHLYVRHAFYQMPVGAHIALYELGMDTKEDNLVSNVRLRSEHYICHQDPVYASDK